MLGSKKFDRKFSVRCAKYIFVCHFHAVAAFSMPRMPLAMLLLLHAVLHFVGGLGRRGPLAFVSLYRTL